MRGFVEAVASAAEAVPAGGSVAALAGASAAALLALVCGVLRRKETAGGSGRADKGTAEKGPAEDGTVVENLLAQALLLKERLLVLVDEDAAAFRAFLGDKHDQAAIGRVSQVPLEVARACAAVVDLSRSVQERTSGPMLGDVLAARHLANAALAAALDIADQDVALQRDADARQRLTAQIEELRRSR